METEVFALDSRSVFPFASPFLAERLASLPEMLAHTKRLGFCTWAVSLK